MSDIIQCILLLQSAFSPMKLVLHKIQQFDIFSLLYLEYENLANRKDMHHHEKDSLKRFTISYQKNSPTSFRLQDRDNNARWNRNFVAGVAATWKKPAFNRTREREETRMRASPLHFPLSP